MNKVILIGRLTRDPDVKNTTSGKTVATFTLAVDRRFKNKDGQKEADFVPIVVWGIVQQYLSKGSQVGISGRLQVRSYDDNDGKRRYVTEVIAEEVNFIGGKKDSGNQRQVAEGPPMGLDEDFHLMADDDDIPF
ncbi:single-stranded DNA-binding protein [Acetobacterium tundrae]|uniref:Single-stranded DNA-binding protein n=1 Tax=Acetobacterium tundrae TaxID=132932 RepID=A0ABR6WPT6_9FIRM|nr:single-stranded DNA-binding protein [Acetobacterium tundrae]MBC3798479.1 single-stranded DNA-binding protein [Acetobacterium tundrae]